MTKTGPCKGWNIKTINESGMEVKSEKDTSVNNYSSEGSSVLAKILKKGKIDNFCD